MQALILAAGEGKRLLPKTLKIPKVMIRVMGKPILEHQILLLRKYGIKDIFINLFANPLAVITYFGDGEKWGVNIVYSREDTNESYRGPMLLGSVGALHNFKDILGDIFFVLYGDVFFRIDLLKMIAFHKQKESLFTIAVHESLHPQDSDLVEFDKDKRITGWLKAPHGKKKGVNSAGLYLINSRVLNLLPQEVPCDFAHDFIPRLIRQISLFAYNTEELMMDMGTIERYNTLQHILKND